MQTRFVSGHGFSAVPQPPLSYLSSRASAAERMRGSASREPALSLPKGTLRFLAPHGRGPPCRALSSCVGTGLCPGLACVGTGLRLGAGRAQLASVAPPSRRLWMRASRPHRRGLACPERSRPEAGAPKLKRPSRLWRKGRCPEGEGNPTGSGWPVVPQCRPGSAPPWPPSPSW
jgi:hypothetical protein